MSDPASRNGVPCPVPEVWCHERDLIEQLRTGKIDALIGSSNRLRLVQDARLVQENQRLLAILEATPDLVAVANALGRRIYLNPAGRKMLGIGENEDIREMHMFDNRSPAVRELLLNEAYPVAEREGVWTGDTVFLSRDGQEIPVLQVILAHRSEDGEIEFYSTVARDITQRKEQEKRLLLAHEVIKNTQEGVFITDGSKIIRSVNVAFSSITGYGEEEVIGKNPRILKSSRHDAEFYDGMWAAINSNGRWQGEIWDRRKNGEVYPAWMSISVITNEQDEIVNYVAIFSDISEVKHSEERLQHMAHYDPLTGLPNRVLFSDRLQQAITQARRQQHMVAIMFLDLDRFKIVNDTLGHDIGDQMLVKVARRLEGCLRAGDTLARQGGDEFLLVLPDAKQPEDVAIVAQRLLDVLSEPLVVSGHEFFMTASVGVAVYPSDGEDMETLVKRADTAMYEAKSAGKNAYQFYAQPMHDALAERMKIENRLKHIVEREELVLHYQPIVRYGERGVELVGAEALVRWEDPEQGLISPDKFISIAEETGMIAQIGEWVLQTACSQTKAWQEEGFLHVPIAVNLSGRQFKRGLAAFIQRVLDRTGLQPGYLALELTESIFMQDVEATIATLGELKAMGVRIFIDDFGMGYSSLSYLKRFSVDSLKIDVSFVRDLATDPDDTTIVSAIIALAHSLNLKVIAEGVETKEQLKFLRRKRCDEFQGYYFSPALPAAKFARVFLENSANQMTSRKP